MARTIHIAGVSKGRNNLSEHDRQEIAVRKAKSYNEKMSARFKADDIHYKNILKSIVDKTIVAGQPHKDDEDRLQEIFDAGNKEWLGIVQRVNNTNKAIRLGAQQFRFAIYNIAGTVTEDRIKDKMQSKVDEQATK